MPRKEKKVKIDERFQKMFTDKNFTVNYFVDKRGSKVKNTSKEDLDKFYSLSDESEEEDEEGEEEQHVEEYEDVKEVEKKKKVAKSKSKLKIEKSQKDKKKVKKSEVNLETASSDKESENDRHFKMDDKSLEVENDDVKDDDDDDDDDSSEEELDISRGEGILDSSSDEEELDFGMVQNEMEHPWGEMHTAAKTTEEATRRLAVCNLDWDRVTAMDLFVLFSSFRPRDGIIEAVKIYPSEYGLEQMKTEDSLGPVQLKDDEDDENKNSHNKEALEASNITTIQDISNFCLEKGLFCLILSRNDSEESEDIPSDVDLSDPYFREEIDAGLSNVNNKGSAKTSKKRKWEVEETEEDKKAKEELELLLMDDKDDKHHFSLKGIMDNEKKTKKQKKRREKEIVNDDFNVDLKDSRFDALFTSHHYAVDPSDPQYRKTKGMESILQERMRRRENGEKLLQANKNKDEGTQRRDPSLSVLVKSVKSKAGQFNEKKVKKRLIKS
ncbi:PREDICTED: ESF1 homolog [Acropora digitifera]|uniref:ESF1 homolog n=1 Tax=Acropora digitifera TaxID=70779 RepID=UPI00077A98AF|nr:PREDICTED: ESF1 homolog [Acropora digitifera]